MNSLTTPYFIPVSNYLILDAPEQLSKSSKSEIKYEILERYFNDLYKLFLNKLSQFDCASSVTATEKKKLKSVLDELIYVKTLLDEETKRA